MSLRDEPLKHLPLPPADRRELHAFCAPEADRFGILKASLERRKIGHTVLPIDGARHIVLSSEWAQNNSFGEEDFYHVMLVAHYDRVPSSPGANDNGAAVFQILDFAENNIRSRQSSRTGVIFTDREEITGTMNPRDQGTYGLARQLKRIGAANLLFFLLDMCGVGNTPVWGDSTKKAGMNSISPESNAIAAMTDFLKKFTGGRDYGVNPMFSDDLGLLLGGYPAVQISLLPHFEAKMLAKEYKTFSQISARAARQRIQAAPPPSWQSAHTPEDRPEALEGASFTLINRLLRELSAYRFRIPSKIKLT